MTASQYKNIVLWTLANCGADSISDSALAAKAVFDNCGAAFPTGSCQSILLTLLSDDYMAWRSCTAAQAQEYANQGIAAAAIDTSRIIVIIPDASALQTSDSMSALFSESASAKTTAGISLNEKISFQFFAYTQTRTFDPPAHQCVNSGVYYESDHPHKQYYYVCDDPDCPYGRHYIEYTGVYGYNSDCTLCRPTGTGVIEFQLPDDPGNEIVPPEFNDIAICTDGSLGPDNPLDLQIPDRHWRCDTAFCKEERDNGIKTGERYLDAYRVPYIVLPGSGEYKKASRFGKLAKLTNKTTGNSAICIVGERAGRDVTRVHEVSIAAIWAVGFPNHATANSNNGLVNYSWEITIYPNASAHWNWSTAYNYVPGADCK